LPHEFDSKKAQATNESSIEAIAWVLPRIAEGSYSREKDGLMVWDDSNNMDCMEHVLMGGDPEQQAALNRCKNLCTADSIRDVCIAYLGPVLGARIADQITEREYWRVVVEIHDQQRMLVSSVQKLLIKQREGLSLKVMAEIEAGVIPEAITCSVISTYAGEIANTFPKLIKRAERLYILDADESAPQEVQEYLKEASRCYLHGRYLACVIVCRSAIEVAIRKRLLSSSRGRTEIEALEECRANTLENLIEAGRRVFSWDKKQTLDDADEIRRRANEAVHTKPLEDEGCIELFMKTRGVVRELYSNPPDILGAS
jgi:hypothetical protein